MSQGRGNIGLDEAQAALEALRSRLDQFVRLRADLAELRADLYAEGSSPRGGLADAKAMEARLFAELEAFGSSGVLIKGYAPLLLDWPGTRDGVAVLWCWLEGDRELEWYHREDCGFPGRRRI
jgi:hypothetical protein